MNNEQYIEAVLFHKGEPIRIKKLMDILGASEEDIEHALRDLDARLVDRGVRLMRNNDKVMLATAPEAGSIIESIIKEELNKELGKAGLETLSIVLYFGPIARSRIDYIRGVNSNFILRNLAIRGLVERSVNPEDHRSFLYQPTFELFAHLGVTRASELPEYDNVRKEIGEFEKKAHEEERDGSLSTENRENKEKEEIL